jgi:methylase of polypeptide subunit release factors
VAEQFNVGQTFFKKMLHQKRERTFENFVELGKGSGASAATNLNARARRKINGADIF